MNNCAPAQSVVSKRLTGVDQDEKLGAIVANTGCIDSNDKIWMFQQHNYSCVSGIVQMLLQEYHGFCTE